MNFYVLINFVFNFFLIWEKFDVNKMRNIGFKLDYVEFVVMGSEFVCIIDFDDIKLEVDYWGIDLVCYVLGVNFFLIVFFRFI